MGAMADELLTDLPRDLPTFVKRFGSDAKCRAYLVRALWPEGFRCGGCGHDEAWSHRKRLIEECAACGKQHSILAGTIFEQTKTGLAKWFLAIYLVTSSKGGISAIGLRPIPRRDVSAADRELQRQMGFGSYGTAWAWLHKIRKAMVAPERKPLIARVAADETLVGGAHSGKPGRGAEGKTVVAGAVEAAPGKGRKRRLGRLRAAGGGARRLGREPERLSRPQRRQAGRDRHRRLVGISRAGQGRLRPRARQSRLRLGRCRAAPAGDPPRLRPRQTMAPGYPPRRGPAETPPGLPRRVRLPLQSAHRQEHQPWLRPADRARRPHPAHHLPRHQPRKPSLRVLER
jgi:hypothetical protein